MYGLQSYVVVVGLDPNLVYRSASPVPPLICMVSVACPAGTLMTKNCWEPVAPARFVTGTPFESGVSPVDAVTVTEAVAVRVAPEEPVTVKIAVPAGAVDAPGS